MQKTSCLTPVDANYRVNIAVYNQPLIINNTIIIELYTFAMAFAVVLAVPAVVRALPRPPLRVPMPGSCMVP